MLTQHLLSFEVVPDGCLAVFHLSFLLLKIVLYDLLWASTGISLLRDDSMMAQQEESFNVKFLDFFIKNVTFNG